MRYFSKRGQEIFGISYGIIFAIIIIVVTIVVGIYVVKAFLSWNECRQLGTYYDHLQTEIDNAWSSDRYCDQFPRQNNPQIIPKSVKYVCYGNLTISPDADNGAGTIQTALNTARMKKSNNIFFYPPEKTCRDLASNKLQHMDINTFTCRKVTSGKTDGIWLGHDVTNQPLVSLSKRSC
jgi:hypothetical protein